MRMERRAGMTLDEIEALPTPLTDRATFEILSSLQSGTDKVVHADVAKSLERRLAAAVMALEWIGSRYDDEKSTADCAAIKEAK